MPFWLGAGLWLATVTTVATAALFGAVCGWVLGYAHRSFIELGRAYARLFGDIRHLCETGELRPGR